MLLALYPIAELTRVIVVSGEYYFPGMKGQFGFELAAMWTMYLAIIPVFLLINNHKIRNYRKKRIELLKRVESKRNQNSFSSH